jgi:hypothetical protein
MIARFQNPTFTIIKLFQIKLQVKIIIQTESQDYRIAGLRDCRTLGRKTLKR